jgi:hypothetical protein
VCDTVGGSKEYLDSLVENTKRKGHFGNTSIDGKIKLKLMLDRGIIWFFAFKNVAVTLE